MATILVTGASRGIGLALVAHFAAGGDQVIAACRSPQSASLLQALALRFPAAVRIEQLDVVDSASIGALAERLGDTTIDTLVNNAGILGGTRQSFGDLDLDAWRKTLETNLIAPFHIAQTFVANLRRSANPKLMVISSELGSSTWPHGGLYIYASSKGGLNRVVQIMAIDLRADNICVVAMHPGLVKTDMAGELGQITADESASGIVKVACALTIEDSGKFYEWNGSQHSW